MALYIKKVSRDRRSFRIVIPKAVVKKMGLDQVDYIFIDDFDPEFIRIKGAFDVEDFKRTDPADSN